MMQPAMSVLGGPARPRSLFARVGSSLLWYGVPAIAILVAVAYMGIAIVWKVNPPVVPVAGTSMRPTLQPGDLAVLKGVDASDVEVGDILAVQVPDTVREKYNLPSPVIHRVIEITEDDQGLRFKTQGDANAGPDTFTSGPADIVGRMAARLPNLGFPVLFFRSRQGLIFLGAAVLVILLYFFIGIIEERRMAAQGATISLHSVLEETRDIKRRLEGTPVPPSRGPPVTPATPMSSRAPMAPAADTAPMPPTLVPVAETSGAGWRGEVDKLANVVWLNNERSSQTNEVVRELVSAVGEYGRHLQSHTAVMINLARTTGELYKAAQEMRLALGQRPLAPRPQQHVETPPSIPLSFPAAGPPAPSTEQPAPATEHHRPPPPPPPVSNSGAPPAPAGRAIPPPPPSPRRPI